jgi:hypothetical protein
MIVFKEERGNPAQKQPQRPTVTEVDHGHRQDAARQPQPRDAGARLPVRAACQVRFRNGRMLTRVVAKIPGPNHKPARLANPRITKERRQDTNRSSAAISGGVAAFPIRAKECVTPCAKPQSRTGIQVDIARVAVGKAALRRSPAPNATRTAKRSPPPRPSAWWTRPPSRSRPTTSARTELVADPAADELKQRIRNRESRKRQSKLSVAEPEIRFDQWRRGCDVHAVHEQDQVQDAK